MDRPPSEMTKSVVDKSMRPGRLCGDLDTRMLMRDDLKRAKIRRHRTGPISELYDVACFSAKRPPSFLKVTVAQRPCAGQHKRSEGGVFDLSYMYSSIVDSSLIVLVAPVA